MRNSNKQVGFLTALNQLLEQDIVLKVVTKNRYLDIGDWFKAKDFGYVAAAKQSDPRSELAVLLHEFIEFILCTYNGISSSEVDYDDEKLNKGILKYNQVRYWKYHLIALNFEKEFCKAVGLSWKQHEKNCKAAFKTQELLHKKVRKYILKRKTK